MPDDAERRLCLYYKMCGPTDPAEWNDEEDPDVQRAFDNPQEFGCSAGGCEIRGADIIRDIANLGDYAAREELIRHAGPLCLIRKISNPLDRDLDAVFTSDNESTFPPDLPNNGDQLPNN